MLKKIIKFAAPLIMVSTLLSTTSCSNKNKKFNQGWNTFYKNYKKCS